jgi:hypothetical protein
MPATFMVSTPGGLGGRRVALRYGLGDRGVGPLYMSGGLRAVVMDTSQ